MAGLLVRTWNVFHGNANPPQRRSYLEQMVRLVVADRPDVVCLQEVPLWAFAHLADWSGMAAFPEVAARATIGPLPSTPAIGGRLTALHPGLLRSAFSGQGNAVLAAPALQPDDPSTLVLNPCRFRREQSRRLRLGLGARLAWAKERRIVQTVRLRLPEGRGGLVANLHATSYPADAQLPDAELRRAAAFADSLCGTGEVCILAGDFNVTADRSETLRELTRPGGGFSRAARGIDHVLVRGAGATEPETWAQERRCLDGVLLSDHAPVEVRVE